MTRNEAIAVLSSERDYQDTKYPAIGGVSATPEGFLLVLGELITQAVAEVTKGKLPPLGDGNDIMVHVRKITATGLRAIEQYGAPVRQAA